MNKRLVFAGGTDWSVEFLETLLQEGFNVVGVLAPPDNRKDRSQKEAAHVLKIEGAKHNITVLQPGKLSDPVFLDKFRQLDPDLAVVAAYGKLFPKNILAIPPLGFINFHPSLLPELRGPSPIASAILEGCVKTGVSIMKLGEGMDDGPILFQREQKIDSRETAETLTRKLVDLGKVELPKIIEAYIEGRITLKPQPKTGVTISKMIDKSAGQINWADETAEQIDRKIRALNPQFKTFTFLENNKRVNLLESAGTYLSTLPAGKYELKEGNLAVGTKKDILLVSWVQVESKKSITATEFTQGYKDGRFL